MSENTDKLNYIKNMLWMMCCDGDISSREKKFLTKAAKAINIDIPDWNGLMKQVLADKGTPYPISDPQKAIATFKSLVVMAKADQQFEPPEKDFLRRFAKSIGMSNVQLIAACKDIDITTMLDPFKKTKKPAEIEANFIAISDDFDKIDDFVKVAQENNAKIEVLSLKDFLASPFPADHIACFHAAPEKEDSIARCKTIIKKAKQKAAAILTRYQGHHVKYLHETGLKKCVIEPVYDHDIRKLAKI